MHATTFPELDQLQALIRRAGPALRADIVATVDAGGTELPVWCIETGSTDLRAPAIGYFGGVHGMERIGTQVLIAWLETVLARLQWDSHFGDVLQQVRLVFMPIVNPGGLLLGTRANPGGVDLMRSAPVDAEGRVLPLLGGHRLGPALPWYRGAVEDPLPPEAAALFEVVRARLHPHPFALAMDCHSGFGFRDRIWFPWARSRAPVPHLAEAFALRALFNQTWPNHSYYLMEPQSLSYTTHGDLWDFLYEEHLRKHGPASARDEPATARCAPAAEDSAWRHAPGHDFAPAPARLFLPFTLEMGSWLWVKKNPRQLFSWFGHFNPILPHRLERVLRRHLILFDFLLHATASHRRWLPRGEQRRQFREAALQRWFPGEVAGD